MLKDNSQKVLDLSPYQGLYEAIIPRDHIEYSGRIEHPGRFELNTFVAYD